MKKYIVENSYKASKGIAAAVLVCLGIGLLLQTLGQLCNITLLVHIGGIAKNLFIPALGMGIAIMLGATPMVVMCAAVVAVIGGGVNREPIGAILAALVSIWIGKRIVGKTNFDMILTPAVCLLSGGIVGLATSKVIEPVLVALSTTISIAMQSSPILSSMIVGLIFALLILSPASSAALAIALKLDPVVSGAALIACSVQFTAFAFLSFKENTIGAFFGQLICTPKLQTPNIIKSPRIMIIPLILSTIMAPTGVICFGIISSSEVAGLGLCAIVAPLYMATTQPVEMLLYFILVSVVIPAIICLLIRPIAFKLKWLNRSDLSIELK